MMYSLLCTYRGDLVTIRDIAFVHKKQKLDKEGRMQAVKVTVKHVIQYHYIVIGWKSRRR